MGAENCAHDVSRERSGRPMDHQSCSLKNTSSSASELLGVNLLTTMQTIRDTIEPMTAGQIPPGHALREWNWIYPSTYQTIAMTAPLMIPHRPPAFVAPGHHRPSSRGNVKAAAYTLKPVVRIQTMASGGSIAMRKPSSDATTMAIRPILTAFLLSMSPCIRLT